MSRKKWEIDRRRVLRGLGAAISLPLLEAMLPSIARGQSAFQAPQFISVCYPLGWLNEGSELITPAIRSALAPIEGNYSITRGLTTWCPAALGTNTNGGHVFNFISSRICNPVHPIPNNMTISFDQVIAQSPQYKGQRKIDHLNMSNFAHFGYTDNISVAGIREVMHNPSWYGPNNPAPLIFQPRQVFNQLVGAGNGIGTPADNSQAFQKKSDVLHHALEEIKSLKVRLGKTDNEILDRHLTNIEEADQRTMALMARDGEMIAACRSIAEPRLYPDHSASNGTEMSQSFAERLRLFQDLMIMSLECELTSVMNFCYGGSYSGDVRPRFFVPGMETAREANVSWHTLSHFRGGDTPPNASDERKRNLVRINNWVHSDFAGFVKRISDIRLPDGQTLLDKCGIVLSTGMGNHGVHAQHPIYDSMAVIAGRAKGRLNMNNMTRYPWNDKVGFSRLWLTLMKAFGLNINSYGIGRAASNQTVQGLSDFA